MPEPRDLKTLIQEKGEDWAVAAVVDGSIGYYSPVGARHVVQDFLAGHKQCCSERCLACFGGDMAKMVRNDLERFLYVEEHQPERAARVVAFCRQWERVENPGDISGIGLAYPTLGF